MSSAATLVAQCAWLNASARARTTLSSKSVFSPRLTVHSRRFQQEASRCGLVGVNADASRRKRRDRQSVLSDKRAFEPAT